LESYSFVQTIRGSFVQQIEPAKDAVRMEWVVRLFSMAFAQVRALRVVDEVVVDGLTVGWQRLERWPCWGRGRAVRLGLTWLRIAVSAGLFLMLRLCRVWRFAGLGLVCVRDHFLGRRLS
jgi:hypothetical protein